MSSDEPNDESATDSQQEAEEQPVDSDQPSAQSDDQPADSDQPADQSDEQPAQQADQREQQAEDQPGEGDQPAEQTEETPAESDQAAEQPKEQPVDTDQADTAATADDTVAFAGGAPSPAGGGGAGGKGSGKTNKVQVIAIFMTNSGGSRFRAGEISMKVFDGAKGNLLWKPGSMNQQQKLTYQDAAMTSNVIHSGSLTVSPGNSVKVELLVRLLGPDHELDPEIPQVDFGTAARFEVPTGATLTVAVDIETTRKEFTVDAKDEISAGDAARRMLASKEEVHLALVDSALEVEPGRFLVVFLIPTKRIRILQPKPLEVIY
jgi:hypothetical protein